MTEIGGIDLWVSITEKIEIGGIDLRVSITEMIEVGGIDRRTMNGSVPLKLQKRNLRVTYMIWLTSHDYRQCSSGKCARLCCCSNNK